MKLTDSTTNRLIPACALIAALMLRATAAGKTNTLQGTVGGDPNGIVSMQIVVRRARRRR